MAVRSTAKSKATKGNNSTLDQAIAGINKQYGEGSIMRLGTAHRMKVSVLSTGSLAMDLALGVGGLPRGRTVLPGWVAAQGP